MQVGMHINMACMAALLQAGHALQSSVAAPPESIFEFDTNSCPETQVKKTREIRHKVNKKVQYQSNDDWKNPRNILEYPAHAEQIILGMGCFWCSEKIWFDMTEQQGIYSTSVGYFGGAELNENEKMADFVTYEKVCKDNPKNHVEVTKLVYNPQILPLKDILVKFWEMHNPTQLNGQGNDKGAQYRSGIWYFSEEQKKIIEESKDLYQEELSKNAEKLEWESIEVGEVITTEIACATGKVYYVAEDYHQQYLSDPTKSYCGLKPTGVSHPWQTDKSKTPVVGKCPHAAEFKRKKNAAEFVKQKEARKEGILDIKRLQVDDKIDVSTLKTVDEIASYICVKTDAPVFMISKGWCPFCKDAKAALENAGAKVEILEIENEAQTENIAKGDLTNWHEAINMLTGSTSVPKIFINKNLFGGCDDILKAEANDELEKTVVFAKLLSKHKASAILSVFKKRSSTKKIENKEPIDTAPNLTTTEEEKQRMSAPEGYFEMPVEERLTKREVDIFWGMTEIKHTGEYAYKPCSTRIYYKTRYFACKQCATPLYSHASKFHCTCGWAAFDKCFENSIITKKDDDGRIEIRCATCEKESDPAHLGHVFPEKHHEGQRSAERHCANSKVLKYVKSNHEKPEEEVIKKNHPGEAVDDVSLDALKAKKEKKEKKISNHLQDHNIESRPTDLYQKVRGPPRKNSKKTKEAKGLEDFFKKKADESSK